MTHTRALMLVSALVTGVAGAAATFAPDLVLRSLGIEPAAMPMLLVQVLGALYLGFAVLSWMVQHATIGGIYNRPVVVGSLLHFTAAGLAMIKALPGLPAPAWAWGLAVVSLLLAVWFGAVMFRHPIRA